MSNSYVSVKLGVTYTSHYLGTVEAARTAAFTGLSTWSEYNYLFGLSEGLYRVEFLNAPDQDVGNDPYFIGLYEETYTGSGTGFFDKFDYVDGFTNGSSYRALLGNSVKSFEYEYDGIQDLVIRAGTGIGAVNGGDYAFKFDKINRDPTGSVTISGTNTEGSKLYASTYNIKDGDGLDSFSYQWLRDWSTISDATSSSYQLTQDDVGSVINVKVSYQDGGGTNEALTSNSTDTVGNVNNLPTGSAVITGIASVGETLTAVTSSIADTDGLGSFSYQWLKAGSDISGATSPKYVLTSFDAGSAISARVQYTDAHGTAEAVTSSATSIVQNVNNAPSISSTAVTAAKEDNLYSYKLSASDLDENDTLTLSAETLPAWLSFISDTGILTGTPTNEDVGRHDITLNVTDAAGAQVSQSFSIDVTNVNDLPTGSAVITGIASVGETLTAVTSSIADTDGLGTFSYQWLRDGNTISFAISPTYSLSNSDIHTAISVKVSYTDGKGSKEQISSPSTSIIKSSTASASDDHGDSSIDATSITVGQTITGSIENMADEDWFTVSLEAGKTYLLVPSKSSGSAVTTYLTIHNSASRYEDGTYTQASFKPETSGTYFIKITDLGDTDTGPYSFTMSEVGLAETYIMKTSVVTRDGSKIADADVVMSDGANSSSYKSAADGSVSGVLTSGSASTITGSLAYSSSTKAVSSQDALDALKLSVGMTTAAGTKTAFDFISADFNQDGNVSSQDALAILKYSVGLTTTEQAKWVFVDTNGDYSGVSKSNTSYTEGVSIADLTADTTVGLTGILIGDVNDSYSGLIA